MLVTLIEYSLLCQSSSVSLSDGLKVHSNCQCTCTHTPKLLNLHSYMYQDLARNFPY